jgi:hypothetical protein
MFDDIRPKNDEHVQMAVFVHEIDKVLSRDYFQIVVSIQEIAKLLNTIDPDSKLTKIREDFDTEITLSQDANIISTITSRECPLIKKLPSNLTKRRDDASNMTLSQRIPLVFTEHEPVNIKTLSRKGLIVQELARCVTILKPHTLNTEIIQSLYDQMKNEADLWSSFYHKSLDKMEQLLQPLHSTPTKYFFKVRVDAFLQHIAAHGLDPRDEEAQTLYQDAATMREEGYQEAQVQYPLFRAFILEQTTNYSFDNIVPEEEQEQFVGDLITRLSLGINSHTLKDKIGKLINSCVVNQELFNAINSILVENEQLSTLSSLEFKGHKLNDEEIETLFAQVSLEATGNTIESAALQRDLALLGRAFPFLKENNDLGANLSNEELKKYIYGSNMVSQIITHEVMSRINPENSLESAATNQLLTHLNEKLKKSGLAHCKFDLNDLGVFIDGNIQSIVKSLPQRKQKLNAMGYGVATFKEIEALRVHFQCLENSAASILGGFYCAIQRAKEKHFYCEQDKQLVMKQIEDINRAAFQEFFAECCVAGEHTAKILDFNCSAITLVVEVLKAIANRVIHILTLGCSLQFFKPVNTPAEKVQQAISDLKATLTTTLDHIAPIPEATIILN